MRIETKLYAGLGRYLPAGARDNVTTLDLNGAATPADVIRALGIPPEHCHLVLVNGLYLAPSERARRRLEDSDVVAIWPPVAGG